MLVLAGKRLMRTGSIKVHHSSVIRQQNLFITILLGGIPAACLLSLARQEFGFEGRNQAIDGSPGGCR